MPDQLKTKVVLAHRNNTWWCIVYGNDSKPIWKTGKGCDTPELALRKMLVSSSDMVFDKFQKDGFALDAWAKGKDEQHFSERLSKGEEQIALCFPIGWSGATESASECCEAHVPRVERSHWW